MTVEPFDYAALGGMITREGFTLPDTLGMTGAWEYVARSRGMAIAAGGIVPFWEGLGYAWALVDVRIRADESRALIRWIREFLPNTPFRRVQATVRASFVEGANFAELCGLTLEGTLRAYGPAGEDHFMYAWVRE